MPLESHSLLLTTTTTTNSNTTTTTTTRTTTTAALTKSPTTSARYLHRSQTQEQQQQQEQQRHQPRRSVVPLFHRSTTLRRSIPLLFFIVVTVTAYCHSIAPTITAASALAFVTPPTSFRSRIGPTTFVSATAPTTTTTRYPTRKSRSIMNSHLGESQDSDDYTPTINNNNNININTTSTTTTTLETWKDGYPKAMIHCILPLLTSTATITSSSTSSSTAAHKGSSGRIGVLGGCVQYTGAPYYAAMASLKTGADLAYVFCAQEAAIPIKCYSPELLVAPVYIATEFDLIVKALQTQTPQAEKLICAMVDPVVSMMERLHCLIIGPGLGRCPMVLEATARIIQHARNRNLPLVIDADGLYLLTLEAYCDVLAGYDKVVLTPNAMEAKRLEGLEHCWQGAIVVQKGQVDLIKSNGSSILTILEGNDGETMVVEDSKLIVLHSMVLTCQEEGGLKRSGGIGDILAGCIGTLVAWNKILQDQEARSKGATITGVGGGSSNASVATTDTNRTTNATTTPAHLPLACWTACCFVKRATKRAFGKHHRAMTAPDILNELGPTIHDMTSMGEDDPIIITSVMSS